MTDSSAKGLEDDGAEALSPFIDHLEGGGLLIHPTETVYGVGGLLRGPATHRLRELKDRREGGFVVLMPAKATTEGLLSATGRALADACWPGPLTMVVDDPDHRFPDLVKAGDGSIAIRVCGHPSTQRLLASLGEPITSTSANRPGEPAPRSYADALELNTFLGFSGGGDLALAGIDGGILPGGPPSTLVDARDDTIKVLRPGRVTSEALQQAAGLEPVAGEHR